MGGLAELADILRESSDPGNPAPARMSAILDEARVIAVVGISRSPEKAARRVPAYLASKGFEIIPVNPHVDQVLGRASRASLDEVTEPVDIVLVFRPPAEAAVIAEKAMSREERPVIWLQEGIRADEVAARARAQGLTVVQDLCVFRVHSALAAGRPPAGSSHPAEHSSG